MNNLERIIRDGEESKYIDVKMFDCRLCPNDLRSFCIDKDNGFDSCVNAIAAWFLEDYVEQDTQEKINEDTLKYTTAYWNCTGCCSECPAKINGEDPTDRYAVESCLDAKIFDLLRRQRELDKRGFAR